GECEPATVSRGAPQSQACELDDQLWHHWQDQAEADRVDEHRHEDEQYGPSAGSGTRHRDTPRYRTILVGVGHLLDHLAAQRELDRKWLHRVLEDVQRD